MLSFTRTVMLDRYGSEVSKAFISGLGFRFHYFFNIKSHFEWPVQKRSFVLLVFLSSGGLVLFGLLSIIMDVFKIVSYAGYLHCDSAVKVAFPVVQLVFIILQVEIPPNTF